MNRFKSVTKPLMWVMALLLVALAAGCGGGSGSGSAVSTTAKAITAYSLAGVTGTINETAKTISVAVPYGTNVTAQVATYTTTGAGVKVGTVAQASGTTANNFTGPVTYIVTAVDGTTATYTVTVSVVSSAAKAITAYSLAGVAGTINETARTIAVTVPYGTSVTDLAAAFTTTGASVKIGAIVQTSGQLPRNDFTSPVTYIVAAVDGTTAIYTVTVTVAANFAKSITAYSLDGVAGVINETAKTISVPMPFGKNVTAMVATFTSTGSGSVTVGSQPQTSGTTPNNFTSPVAYIVTAADSTTMTYAVTVNVALNSAKAITAYSLDGVAGVINETAKTISVSMPSGKNVTAMVATFTTTGAGVKVGTVAQTSGTTQNNFTSPVAYIVTAADTTTATYTVTVTVAAALAPVALGTAGNFVIFSNTAIANPAGGGTITGDMGVGPGVTSTAISGFGLILDSTQDFSISSLVVGKVYAFDYKGAGAGGLGTTPAKVTTASNDMLTAYNEAAGRPTPDFTELYAGDISGRTLVPGLYKWSNSVLINTNVTLSGGANDVWIFQIAQDLTIAAGGSVPDGIKVLLSGGAKASNVFWQVGGLTGATLGTYSTFEGNILSAKQIIVQTGAVLNGRALAQTQVSLAANLVTKPAP